MTMRQPHPLPPGTQLGQYTLQCIVGRGAYGDVYRAHHRHWLERRVAIKVPHDTAAAEQLARAGLVQGRFDHPAIVRVLDLITDPPTAHLVLEWIEGETLAQHIDRTGPLDPQRASAVLLGILDGLDAIQRAGHCHGDLKPSNILLALDGRVLLTDFGYGPPLTTQQRGGAEISLGSEAIGHSAATLSYLPPEQRAGRVADSAADLYALGVILFEVLAGRQPALADQLASPVATQLYRALCAPPDQRINDHGELRRRLVVLANEPRSKTQPQPRPTPLTKLDHSRPTTSGDASLRRALWIFGLGMTITVTLSAAVAAIAFCLWTR
jgi:serine/threonine protein kinase